MFFLVILLNVNFLTNNGVKSVFCHPNETLNITLNVTLMSNM